MVYFILADKRRGRTIFVRDVARARALLIIGTCPSEYDFWHYYRMTAP